LEEFGAFFLLVSTAVGIQVFVEEFPHVVGQAKDFQVFGVLESVLEFLGHSSEVFGFPHDFADEPLLAVQVIVVELFVQVLEHGDPLDDVHSLVAISIIVGPILRVLRLVVVLLVLLVVIISVVAVSLGSGAKESTNIDQVANNSEKNNSSQKGKGSGGA